MLIKDIDKLQSTKNFIKNLSYDEIKDYFNKNDQQTFRADQLYLDLYSRRCNSFDEILTLPKNLRDKLTEDFHFYSLEINNVRYSSDGSVKFLFKLTDGNYVEAVFMPWYEADSETIERATLCISSMAGCPVKCTFCATGSMGKIRNLTTAEIVDQVLLASDYMKSDINNIVFMGMGEPLLNYHNVAKSISIFTDSRSSWLSRRKITLSTVGIPVKIKALASHPTPVKLALSLHATTNDVRNQIIPVLKNIPLEDIFSAVEYFYRKTKMPITYEYIPFAGLNDTLADAKRLAKISRRVPSRVNLIPYNDISFTNPQGFAKDLKPTPIEEVHDFAKHIRDFGGWVTVRDTFGQDIEAACGQLALSQ